MKKKLLLPFLGLILINIISCANNISTGETGYILTSVKFPDRKFSIKFIPEQTQKILVRVNGKGIDSNNPPGLDLDRKNTSGFLADIPEGEKTVKAIAMNANGEIIASGESNVNVIARKVNRVEVTLNEVIISSSSPGPTPTATSSSNPVPTPTATSSPSSIETVNPSLRPSEPVITNSSPNPNVTNTPSQPDKGCIVYIIPADDPLTASLRKSIIDAGCTIELIPRLPSPSPVPVGGNPGDTSGGGSSGSTLSSANINLTVRDASPLPPNTFIATPVPSPV